MKRSVWFFALIVCISAVSSSWSAALATTRLESTLGRKDRSLGDIQVGNIDALGTRIDIGGHAYKSFSLSLNEYDNRVSDTNGLLLPKTEIAFGSETRVDELHAFRFATNINTYNLGEDDYWGAGASYGYRGDWWQPEIGVQGDQKNEALVYGTLRRKVGHHAIMVGASKEHFEEGHYEIEKIDYSRVGAGVHLGADSSRAQMFVGYVANPETKGTVVGGTAFVWNLEAGPGDANPSFMAAWRGKPEASIGQCIVSLYGNLMQRIAGSIMRSYLTGAYWQSRVLNNWYFGHLGTDHTDKQEDFGLICFAGTYVKIDAGAARIIQSELALSGTLPRTFWIVSYPYCTVGIYQTTDLIFNMRMHSLDDHSQRYSVLRLGWRSPVIGRQNRTLPNNGSIRPELNLRFHDTFGTFEGVKLGVIFLF